MANLYHLSGAAASSLEGSQQWWRRQCARLDPALLLERLRSTGGFELGHTARGRAVASTDRSSRLAVRLWGLRSADGCATNHSDTTVLSLLLLLRQLLLRRLVVVVRVGQRHNLGHRWPVLAVSRLRLGCRKQ